MKVGKKMTLGSIVEKKISIYEKALQIFPDSEDLIVGHLQACQQIYE
jgi:hypothetical protein